MSHGLLTTPRPQMQDGIGERTSERQQGLRMSGRVFGYARDSARRRVPDREAQRQLIAGYCASRGWPFEAGRQFFADVQDVRHLADRKAGSALWRCVRRGDHVVTPSLDRVFAT